MEDYGYKVLDCARTFDEIAVKWQAINTHKRIVDKMNRVSSGSTDQRLNLVG